jgi:hypothetical protein
MTFAVPNAVFPPKLQTCPVNAVWKKKSVVYVKVVARHDTSCCVFPCSNNMKV